jgi:hypothetical protein
MPSERCYVGVILNGSEQFYQRDMERKGANGRFEAVPFFVLNRSEAAVMSEAAAKAFVARLRSLGANPWIQDAKDGRRIDVSGESTQSGEDTRTPVAATLDDENSPEARWYVVKPICRPEGRKWFLKIIVPGLPDPYVTYGDDALATLKRAEDLGYLRFAERYERTQPQQAPAPQNSAGALRRRPGSIK